MQPSPLLITSVRLSPTNPPNKDYYFSAPLSSWLPETQAKDEYSALVKAFKRKVKADRAGASDATPPKPGTPPPNAQPNTPPPPAPNTPPNPPNPPNPPPSSQSKPQSPPPAPFPPQQPLSKIQILQITLPSGCMIRSAYSLASDLLKIAPCGEVLSVRVYNFESEGDGVESEEGGSGEERGEKKGRLVPCGFYINDGDVVSDASPQLVTIADTNDEDESDESMFFWRVQVLSPSIYKGGFLSLKTHILKPLHLPSSTTSPDPDEVDSSKLIKLHLNQTKYSLLNQMTHTMINTTIILNTHTSQLEGQRVKVRDGVCEMVFECDFDTFKGVSNDTDFIESKRMINETESSEDEEYDIDTRVLGVLSQIKSDEAYADKVDSNIGKGLDRVTRLFGFVKECEISLGLLDRDDDDVYVISGGDDDEDEDDRSVVNFNNEKEDLEEKLKELNGKLKAVESRVKELEMTKNENENMA